MCGRNTFTATVFGAMHLRDRGGGDRRAEALEQLRHRLAESLGDGGLRLRLRKRRHPILQGFEIAGDFLADDVRPRRQELAELDVGRTEPGKSGGEPHGAAAGVAALDHARKAQQKLRPRRRGGGIDEREHAFAGEHPAGLGQPQQVENAAHCFLYSRQPECSATMPPLSAVHCTREKPAVRIMAANFSGAGKRRIDSTR
jgi:hypothetical protein